MAPLMDPFPLASTLRSQLITDPPLNIPSVEELTALEDELKSLKSKAEKRTRKAEQDIRTLETVRRKLKEKERESKGSSREKELKLKLERTSTPDPEVSNIVINSLKRPGLNNKAKFDLLKKKKRKRDADSEGEENHKVAKSSPAPSENRKHSKPVFQLPPRVTANGFRIAEDFSEPSTSTLPPRPSPQAIPTPGPKQATDVQEDFSKSKPPTQVAITTFYSSIEPWLRPIREDEVGLLQWDGDTIEPFLVPPLGKHYSEVWEEEDRAFYGYPLVSSTATANPGPSTSQRITHNASWDPTTISDVDLGTDERSVGPLTERLLSALIPGASTKVESSKVDEPSSSVTKPAKPPLLNTMDLEERIRGELISAGLFDGEEHDFGSGDDQILSELRRCQRALRSQMALNKTRRQRLMAIAQDRLAYQDYVENRDAIDRQITAIYSRLQKRESAKNASAKKRKKPGSAALAAEEKEKDKPICPAGLGLVTDARGRLVVDETLMKAVRLRRQWVDTVGGYLAKKNAEEPGRLRGLPQSSIYEGIEEDIKQLERLQDREGDG